MPQASRWFTPWQHDAEFSAATDRIGRMNAAAMRIHHGHGTRVTRLDQRPARDFNQNRIHEPPKQKRRCTIMWHNGVAAKTSCG